MQFRFDPADKRFRIRTLVPADRTPRVFADGDFQFGIEEEYFLADAETFEAPRETPDSLFRAAELPHLLDADPPLRHCRCWDGHCTMAVKLVPTRCEHVFRRSDLFY